jgi:hypothetical protein
LFNPSLLDVGDDPRLPTNVPARLGAVAAPVVAPVELAPAAAPSRERAAPTKPELPAVRESDEPTVDGPEPEPEPEPSEGDGVKA